MFPRPSDFSSVFSVTAWEPPVSVRRHGDPDFALPLSRLRSWTCVSPDPSSSVVVSLSAGWVGGWSEGRREDRRYGQPTCVVLRSPAPSRNYIVRKRHLSPRPPCLPVMGSTVPSGCSERSSHYRLHTPSTDRDIVREIDILK